MHLYSLSGRKKLPLQSLGWMLLKWPCSFCSLICISPNNPQLEFVSYKTRILWFPPVWSLDLIPNKFWMQSGNTAVFPPTIPTSSTVVVFTTVLSGCHTIRPSYPSLPFPSDFVWVFLSLSCCHLRFLATENYKIILCLYKMTIVLRDEACDIPKHPTQCLSR